VSMSMLRRVNFYGIDHVDEIGVRSHGNEIVGLHRAQYFVVDTTTAKRSSLENDVFPWTKVIR